MNLCDRCGKRLYPNNRTTTCHACRRAQSRSHVGPNCSCCGKRVLTAGKDRCSRCRKGSCRDCNQRGHKPDYQHLITASIERLDELAGRLALGLPLFPNRRSDD